MKLTIPIEESSMRMRTCAHACKKWEKNAEKKKGKRGGYLQYRGLTNFIT